MFLYHKYQYSLKNLTTYDPPNLNKIRKLKTYRNRYTNYNKNQSCIIYTFYPVLKHKSFIRLHHALNHWCHIIIFILC